ncbi:MAG: MarR family transcriptional regulator [Vicinamibacteria bacterium]|nr:MarR family transcriptional regulator [Vicinamibacteria bacterium]
MTQTDFETLAAFRQTLARFLGFSEAAAAAQGLTPTQYQALLALKGSGGALSIGELAERLHVHHHSAVGLVDRLEALGLARRALDAADGRRVRVTPTAKGERRVAQLAAIHRDELQTTAKTLGGLLRKLVASPRSRGRAKV